MKNMKNMKKTNKGLAFSLVVGMLAFMLAGCNHQHDALHGIYYGYYSNGDPHEFYILAFSKDHPKQIALRKNMDNLKVDSVFSVTYGKNDLTVHTPEENVIFLISNNGMTLTCPSCDGTNGPRTYQYGEDKGKAFPAKIGDIAYKSISKNAKAHGLYLPGQAS